MKIMICLIPVFYLLLMATSCTQLWIFTNEATNITTKEMVSYKHHLNVNTSKGLVHIMSIYENIIKYNTNLSCNSFAFIHSSSTNHILKTFFNQYNRKIFNYLDPGYLKLTNNNEEEHDVAYDESLLQRINNFMNEGYSAKTLAVVVYKMCLPSLIKTLQQVFKFEESGTALCYAIKDDDQLELLKDNISHFTHLWLLLSPLDTESFLLRLTGIEYQKTQVITTMLPLLQFQYITWKYEFFSISNINYYQLSNATLNITRGVIETIKNLFSVNQTQTIIYQDEITRLLRHSIPIKQKTASLQEPESYQKKRTIKVTTVIFPPYVMFVHNEIPDRTNNCHRGHACHTLSTVNGTTVWTYRCCYGLSIDLFHHISNILNLNYYLYITPDGSFGAFKNGSWNGMIGQLIADKADIAIQGLEPTVQRSRHVKFTPAYMYSHYAIIRRTVKDKPEIINWLFLEPLQISLLVSILIATIAIILFLFFSENSKYVFGKISDKYFPSREVMTYTFGLTFQRDMGGKNPVNWSGRVSALGYATAMTIVMTTYTAHITANNIHIDGNVGFNGLKDKKIIEPSPSFKFAVMKDTSQESFFLNHPSSKFIKIWNFMKEYSVRDTAEGVEKVFNGELDAFISDDNSVIPITAKRKYCSSVTIYNEFRRQSEVSFAYQKDFLLGKLISHVIIALVEKRFTDELKKKWIYIPSCYEFDAEENRFTLIYFGGMLLIMGVTVFVCIVVVLVENIYVFVSMRGNKVLEDDDEIRENMYLDEHLSRDD